MEFKEFIEWLGDVTIQYRKLLTEEFNARWENQNTDLMKTSQFEVIWGLVGRQCTFLIQTSYSYYTWNGFYLPIIMRCMAENYINLAWILKSPDQRSRMFIKYGLGRESKILESMKAKSMKSDEDLAFIEANEKWINQQSFHALNEINLGSWKASDVRNTAIEADKKEYYDLFYDAGSFAVHSTWNYIAKNNLRFCDSPFHKNHRIPIVKEPIIEIEPFLILTKIMQDTFDLVDKELNINIHSASAFEYFDTVIKDNEHV